MAAEDVLHRSYLKVLDGRARFQGKAAFKTWLFSVIRRTAWEEQRWDWSQAVRLGQWWRERPDPVPEQDEVDRAKQATRVEMALKALSPKQALVLHLVFYQDLSLVEAAEVLGMRAGTVRTHYERGKARLRSLLGRKELVG